MSRKEEIEKRAEEYALKETITDGAYYEALAAFKVGAEWADKTMLDKACEWLNSNFNMPNDFEQHFRKAMEE